MDAGDRLHERPVNGQLVHPVRQRGREAAELPHQVGVAEHPVLQRHAAAPRVHRSRPQHQPWKIDRPAMRRRIRAVVVAELALVAEVDDFLHVGRRQLLDVPVDRLDVDPAEHHLERRTQRQTPPTPIADVVHPPQLGIDRRRLPKLRQLHIERRIARHQSPRVPEQTWSLSSRSHRGRAARGGRAGGSGDPFNPRGRQPPRPARRAARSGVEARWLPPGPCRQSA